MARTAVLFIALFGTLLSACSTVHHQELRKDVAKLDTYKRVGVLPIMLSHAALFEPHTLSIRGFPAERWNLPEYFSQQLLRGLTESGFNAEILPLTDVERQETDAWLADQSDTLATWTNRPSRHDSSKLLTSPLDALGDVYFITEEIAKRIAEYGRAKNMDAIAYIAPDTCQFIVSQDRRAYVLGYGFAYHARVVTPFVCALVGIIDTRDHKIIAEVNIAAQRPLLLAREKTPTEKQQDEEDAERRKNFGQEVIPESLLIRPHHASMEFDRISLTDQNCLFEDIKTLFSKDLDFFLPRMLDPNITGTYGRMVESRFSSPPSRERLKIRMPCGPLPGFD